MKGFVIRGGTVVTAEWKQQADVAISEGKIAGIGRPGTLSGSGEGIDAAGLLVLPGLVDPHVHLGHRVLLNGEWVFAADDITSGTAFAAAGGTTTVIDVAIQREHDLRTTAVKRREELERAAVVDCSLHPAITKSTPETLREVALLMRAGVMSFKLYMAYRKQGRMGDDAMLRGALEQTSRNGGLVIVHAENDSLADFNIQLLVADGKTSAPDFARSKPSYVEAEAINRAALFAEQVGGSLYVFHVSSREGLEQIARGRARGTAVFAETCPHYLLLTEERLHGENGHHYICSPPLRSPDDIEALWLGVRDGLISIVSSDHCGYDTHAKNRGHKDFTRVPNGLPGVGLRLQLIHTAGVVPGRISDCDLVRLLSTNPARLCGLFPRKGTIAVGSDADLVLVDAETRRRVVASDLDTPVDWSPYEGMELAGWPVTTISRGEVIAENGRCTGTPGRGRFLERKSSGMASVSSGQLPSVGQEMK